MEEVCHDVAIEPLIQLLQGENFDNSTIKEYEARLDVEAYGLLCATVSHDASLMWKLLIR